MAIKNYDDVNGFKLDVLKEIGSIGTGNAATALSSVLSQKIEMSLPEVKIMDYNKAIKEMGGAERIVNGVLVAFSGEINGLMLYMQDIDLINVVLERLLNDRKISDYTELTELDMSALIEVANIIISSYVNAISSLTGITIQLSVPAICTNMLGAIVAVPMAEYGYETDKIMSIGGNFKCNGKEVYSRLMMLPEIESLNFLMKKLGVESE
ncbi:MAG: chemotaxis protein CheC [Firmicutes bacterium]|nr:chemotaxis protein CheC [Bacillota bacterium]